MVFMSMSRLDGRFHYPGRKNRFGPKLMEAKKKKLSKPCVRIDGPRGGGELGLFQISKIDKTTLTYAMLVRLNSPTG